MDNIKKKRFKQLKKSHAWVSIVLFVIFAIILAASAVAFIAQFIVYTSESKIHDEYLEAVNLGRMYEVGNSEGDGIYKYLDATGRSYVIFAEDGTELHRSGSINVNGTERTLTVRAASDDVKILRENDVWIFSDNGDGTASLNMFGVIGAMKREAELKEDDDEEYEDEDLRDLVRENRDVINLPFLIEAPAGSGRIAVQASMTFRMKDVDLFLTILSVISALTFVVFVTLLINIISGALRRRRTLNVFFTDIVTNGHNWMWLLIKGHGILKKMKNRPLRYAVIDLVFVNYRNFCACHSVAEGEKMLRLVYETINKSMTSREMCVHVTSSHFAVVMAFSDKEALESRVKTLISVLEGISPGRRISFHAGIDIIEPEGTVMPDGKVLRRKDLDLELEHNKACTARSTLEASDDSGVAFFDEKLVEEQKWKEAVQERQASALANEEFVVYYQPKYDPTTDRLKGAEALIRWQSPEFGFVPPGRIIPIFEKNGFITEIDHYMITHVARDQKAWLDRGFNCVPVSVNVSRAHFIESDLAEQIRDMVDAAGCPHNYIEIELTESAFFDDKKAMISTIAKLKEYGFAVSMDDFGSGYSSLNSLKDMPLDVLKLDAEFFRGKSEDGRGEIVVAEAIRLAKSLNMRTVAEGVEIRDQVDFLAAQGCDMIQGYFYAKPMPGADFEQRMKDGVKQKE